jgi:hypothetical protein
MISLSVSHVLLFYCIYTAIQIVSFSQQGNKTQNFYVKKATQEQGKIDKSSQPKILTVVLEVNLTVIWIKV